MAVPVNSMGCAQMRWMQHAQEAMRTSVMSLLVQQTIDTVTSDTSLPVAMLGALINSMDAKMRSDGVSRLIAALIDGSC